ncbi:Hypothetical protein, predicted lipoprotein [Metamycoplasma auris 15026]|uniref:DUF31 domain-containing protein n=1 Tax=Metamycoplasma auris 15026 TaxID=1188233 RepID=N9V086_9BACT|nr:Hypothetical protein, predicted lipoprotein [Metamycoplasma auris 15026]
MQNKLKLALSFFSLSFPLVAFSCKTEDENKLDSNLKIEISIPNQSNLQLDNLDWNDIEIKYDSNKYQIIKESLIKRNGSLVVRIKVIKKALNGLEIYNEIIKEESFFNFKKPNETFPNSDSNKDNQSNNPTDDNSKNNKPNISPTYSNHEKLVYDSHTIYTKDKYPAYFFDRHLFDENFVFNNDVYTITRSTPKFKSASHNINVFLKNGNYGNPIDFQNYNIEADKEFWSYTKDIGYYGNYGKNPEEKVAFYNKNIALNGMVKQAYLDNFNKNEISSLEELNLDLNSIIKSNPFGYLPSNLSQLFYYLDFKSISKIFKIENIIEIKANFNDEVGEIEFLLEDKKQNKYYLKIDKNNSSYLKNNLDFYQYIYDRSFMMLYYGTEWFRDPFGLQKEHLSYTSGGGTLWVVDRIINPNDEKNDYWELLVATNIHVFSLNKIFDKSLYFFKNENKEKSSRWKAGFYGPSNLDSFWNDLKNRTNNKFLTIKPKVDKLTSNFIYGSEDAGIPTIDAYSQYLDMPYYTPRYFASDFKIDHPDTASKWFEEYNKESYIGKTQNAGADFVLLKMKIKKDQLHLILPKLAEIIGTKKEKDWYVGLGKNELASPYKTQFYAGYPNYSFKGNKSTGGIISTQNRYVKEDDFKSLWVRYDAQLNKDWNSHQNRWKEYTEPFVNDKEHGMPLNILTQHSTLYTRIEKNKENDALDSGSSGSMAIDSSFNLIGINYLLTQDQSHDTTTNAINLIQGQGDYKNKDDGNILVNAIKKLKNDNLHTIKLNPLS